MIDTMMKTRDDGEMTAFAEEFRRLCAYPHETRTGGSSTVSLIRVDQPGHEKIVPGVPDIVLRLVFDGDIRESEVDCGEGPVTLSGRQGSVYVAPAYAEAAWRSEGDHSLLMVALPAVHVARLYDAVGASGGHGDPLGRLYGQDIFDPVLPRMIETLWAESLRDGPAATLAVDGRATALLGRLLQLSEPEAAAKAASGPAPLDVERLSRVTAFIDDHLHEAVSLAELAAVAGRSPFHFARCFRAATGASPHRFVMARRVDAARRLLVETSEPLAEIAYRCGFSSQAHFSTSFRKHLGATPGRYRAEVRR
ncbi:MAG: AraC family transcriptional regulator [Pseudomonadota bacterium]